MKEIVLKDNPSNRRIFVDKEKPNLSLIPKNDVDLFISLLEIEMYEHFKKRRKPRDKP